MKLRPVFFLTLLLPLLATPAFAEDNAAVQERLDKLERDLMLTQRSMARGGVQVPAAATTGDVNTPPENPAQIEVRLSAIEDELRGLRGKLEENEFQARKLADNFDKLQRDTDFRFNEINQKMLAATTPPETIKNGIVLPAKPEKNPDGTDMATSGDVATQPAEAEKKIDPDSLATPRELYSYAFRLLNQTKYEDAAVAFELFTKKFTKDALVGNAYYWEGETYYIRRDYVSAADNFRQGFEAMPEGPKAADNLLKLAMSLSALKRDKESCVVLGQIVTKFKQSSSNAPEKAAQEQKRIGCK